MDRIADLQTPALLLDQARLERNLKRMAARAAALGVALRPHMKTAKSVDVARRATAGQAGGITVSTLKEAEYFAAAGFADITYAIGITADKLARAAALQQRHGATIGLVLDSLQAARAVAAQADALQTAFAVHVEIDSGQHRAGIAPDDADLAEIGRTLHDGSGTRLAGVLTHAGHSYNCRSVAAIAAVAEAERAAAVQAAEALRAAGLPCPVVSVGSTPTALHAHSLAGATEMRPGVYMFGDRFQAAIGSCDTPDLALSVLASVVGVWPRDGRALIDAGALALSQDRSMEAIDVDAGYGAVFDADGVRPLGDLRLANVNQEHGFLIGDVGDLAPGDRVRVFPNHACMTAAMYDAYNVLDADGAIAARWTRVGGW